MGTNQREGLSRRGFMGVAAAAIGAGTIASVGMLNGCSAPSNQQQASGTQAQGGKGAPASGEINPQESYTEFTTDYSALYEPITIGSLKLRNRFVKSAAGSDTYNPKAGFLNDNFLDYYENFAKGGASLVFVEGLSSLHAINPKTQAQTGLLAGDNAVELLKPIAERVHAHGAYIGYQWYSMTLNSSDITIEEIKYVQQEIVALAVKFKEAGFDAFEFNAASNHFLNSFLSRHFNKREDEYGPQSVESRTKLLTELIGMIKAACGEDFSIQILMNAVEENDAATGDNNGFITIEESIETAKALEKAGADSFYVRASVPGMHIAQFAPDLNHVGYKTDGITGYGTQFDYSQHFGGMINGQWSGCASWLKAAAEIKKAVGIPVGCSGYMDPRTAPDLTNNAVADGEIDFLLITRPLTVDPELPNKLQAGKRDEVAPCCRCMHCHNRGGAEIYADDGRELCRVNAVTQRAYTEEMPEGYELVAAETPKKVMVVGGGPAGMEAARIAALRGHEVSLYEKAPSLGGLLKTAQAYKGDHERLGDLVDYLARQQELAGVTVVTGTEVDASVVKDEGPDVVVVAVGAKREGKLSSTSAVQVVNPDTLVGADLGEKVVITGAGAQAIDCAFYLLAEGKKVQIVHEGPQTEVGAGHSKWVRTFEMPHLYAKGVKIWTSAKIGSIADGGLSITTDAGIEKVLECDSVVECAPLPNDDLASSLSGYEVHSIGDCASPQNILQAIATGNLTARKI